MIRQNGYDRCTYFKAECQYNFNVAAHFVLGEMLRLVRYIKARRRGQQLVCWSYLSAKVSALFRWYHQDMDSDHFSEQALTTWGTIVLDRRLPEDMHLDLLGLVDCRTPQAMDAALVVLSRRIAQAVLPGCGPADAPAAGLAHQYLAFIESELESNM